MKLIEAIIRPEKLEPLKDAFLEAKVNGMNVRQILGCGNQFGWVAHNRGTSVMMNMLPKIEIKVIASAFLSNPAARPKGFLKFIPIALIENFGSIC